MDDGTPEGRYLVDELEERLDDRDKALLDRVLDALAEEKRYSQQGMFAKGYSLGALMILEILEQKDIFLPQKR